MRDEVKVAGIWELNWNSPLTESWLWTFVLREFDITDWHMTPVTGIHHNESHTDMSLTEHDTCLGMVDYLAEDDSYTRVFIDEKGDTCLTEFQHPEKAIYFFGCAGRAPTAHRREGDVVVSIPTLMSQSVLWPHQCLLTVLHDRYVKSIKAGM